MSPLENFEITTGYGQHLVILIPAYTIESRKTGIFNGTFGQELD